MGFVTKYTNYFIKVHIEKMKTTKLCLPQPSVLTSCVCSLLMYFYQEL
jgi:hypothetical protein